MSYLASGYISDPSTRVAELRRCRVPFSVNALLLNNSQLRSGFPSSRLTMAFERWLGKDRRCGARVGAAHPIKI